MINQCRKSLNQNVDGSLFLIERNIFIWISTDILCSLYIVPLAEHLQWWTAVEMLVKTSWVLLGRALFLFAIRIKACTRVCTFITCVLSVHTYPTKKSVAWWSASISLSWRGFITSMEITFAPKVWQHLICVGTASSSMTSFILAPVWMGLDSRQICGFSLLELPYERNCSAWFLFLFHSQRRPNLHHFNDE